MNMNPFSFLTKSANNEAGEPTITDMLDDNIKDHIKNLEEKSVIRLQKITKTLDLVEQLTDDARKDQDNLRTERDIWKATFNAIPNLIVVLDKNRKVIRVNKSFINHINLPKSKILGLSCDVLLDKSFCDCNNSCHIDGKVKIDFKTCEVDGKYFTISYAPIMKDREIDGHILQYQEITDRVRKQIMLRRRDAIINAINETTEKMLKDTSADNGFRIEQMISKLGKAAEVSRVSIYQNYIDKSDKLFTSQKFEWCAEYAKLQSRNPMMQNINFNITFSRWVNSLSKGKSIYGHVEDFPDSEQEFLYSIDVKSTLVVPIYVSDLWTGFVRIDNTDVKRHWDDPEIHSFQMAANVLGAWIERSKVEKALKELIKNANPNKKKLGEYIVEEGLLSREQLTSVLKKQEKELSKDTSSYKYIIVKS